MDVKLPARWANEPTRLAAVRLMREVGSTVEPVLGNIVRIAAEAVRAPLQIPDLLEDSPYAIGPLTAADPGARSYAGGPVLDTCGNVLGALAVLNREPSALGPERVQLLGLLADQVTAILTLGEAAARSVAEADAPGRFDNEFIALITHEVRTPVAVIVGNLELLDEPGDLPDLSRERMVGAIRRNADRLVRLVDHLLVAARAGDALAATVSPSPVDLNGVVSDAVRAAEPRAKQAGIALDLQLDSPLTVPGDATMVRTAIDNLISNALLFTPPGGRVAIQVSKGVRAHDDVELGGREGLPREVAGAARQGALVTVADTGVGIPAEELPRVFERFYRGGHAGRVEAPGAGLGLAVTEAIAAAHDGLVHLDSTPGNGTTARLVLPLDPGPLGRTA